MKWKWKSLSPVWLFATPWTVVHGILQARILEWVAFPFSRRSSQPRIYPGLLHCRQILYQLSYQGSPLNNDSFSTSQVPLETTSLPVCMNLITVYTSYKWSHTLFVFLCLAYLISLMASGSIHAVACSMHQNFLPYYIWKMFHCMCIPHFVHLFIHWWTHRLLPLFFFLMFPSYWVLNSICPPIWKTCAKLLQSCPTLCDPMDCSPPGSSVHGFSGLENVSFLSNPKEGQCQRMFKLPCSCSYFLY